MWLILAEANDTTGIWAYLGLERRGLSPIEYILPKELLIGSAYTHRLSEEGDATTIELDDGRKLESGRIRGVLNRLNDLPQGNHHLDAKDQAYVNQENHALLMSWLFALSCPVLSPPSAVLLSGEEYGEFEWVMLALEAGFPVPNLRAGTQTGARLTVPAPSGEESDDHREIIIVVGDQVIAGNDIPASLIESCRNLSDLSRVPLLGVDLALSSSGDWRFLGASSTPELRLGGDRVLNALAQYLKSS